MDKKITIGEISKRVDLPAKTIRFYEEEGLITKPKRAENGYRLYDADAIEKLQIIKHTRDLGLPLAEVKRLMEGCENGKCKHSAEYIKTEISVYIETLDKKIRDMVALKNKLKLVSASYGNFQHDSKYCCNILGQLSRLKGGDKL